jgi:hypothetical protein
MCVYGSVWVDCVAECPGLCVCYMCLCVCLQAGQQMHQRAFDVCAFVDMRV